MSARVDGRSWDTSVWRNTSGETLLPVPAHIRAGKKGGDEVLVDLSLRITMRQATARDVACVSGILLAAAEWLASRGIPMWRDEELVESRIEADVQSGQVYLADHADDAVATVKVQWSDPQFWPDVPDGDSLYLHRLAVRRAYARGLVSRPVFTWAIERAAAAGRRYVRLDCEASRPTLRAVYERAGFRFHSERRVGPYLVARYGLDVSRRDT